MDALERENENLREELADRQRRLEEQRDDVALLGDSLDAARADADAAVIATGVALDRLKDALAERDALSTTLELSVQRSERLAAALSDLLTATEFPVRASMREGEGTVLLATMEPLLAAAERARTALKS